ncbi:MAG: hypothetical protein KGP14_15270, partial [Betaproteobacteria bacterium]|nr:hypothetical protein [Betaproteobacteria bacterium]
NPPPPVLMVGRVVKMADVEPGRLPAEAKPRKAQSPYRRPIKKALPDARMDFDRAMVLARRWAKFRCRPEIEPVRQVLRHLLAEIDGKQEGIK